MADPVSIFISVANSVNSMRLAYELIQSNNKECTRLKNRIESLLPAIEDLKKSSRLDNKIVPKLNEFISVINEAIELFTEFKKNSLYNYTKKILFRNTNQAKFAAINSRLAQIGSDLSMILNINISITNKELLRKEDIEDTMASMQEMVAEILAHVKDSGETDQSNFVSEIQKEIRDNYQKMFEELIKHNNYSPLSREEVEAIQHHQSKLVSDCDKQFKEIVDGILRIEKQVQIILGNHADESKRVDQLRDITVPMSDIEVLNKIAEGGFGTVYLGLHEGSDKVALKVIQNKDGRELTKEQLKEAENEILIMNLARKSKHVLQPLGIVYDGLKRVFLVFELAAIGSLWDVLRNFKLFPLGSIPVSLFIAVCMDASSAISFLHNLGIRHKDIKAQNLLLFSDLSNRFRIKICDFGLAKQSKGSLTATKTK